MANFSFRCVSWSKAWAGFEDVFRCFLILEEEPARAENVTFVWLELWDVGSGTSSCVYYVCMVKRADK